MPSTEHVHYADQRPLAPCITMLKPVNRGAWRLTLRILGVYFLLLIRPPTKCSGNRPDDFAVSRATK